jgi:hypothetical protein
MFFAQTSQDPKLISQTIVHIKIQFKLLFIVMSTKKKIKN